jgi:hypothetical protein
MQITIPGYTGPNGFLTLLQVIEASIELDERLEARELTNGIITIWAATSAAIPTATSIRDAYTSDIALKTSPNYIHKSYKPTAESLAFQGRRRGQQPIH